MPPDVVALVAAGRGAQDLERQDPARGHARAVPAGRAGRAPRTSRRAVAAAARRRRRRRRADAVAGAPRRATRVVPGRWPWPAPRCWPGWRAGLLAPAAPPCCARRALRRARCCSRLAGSRALGRGRGHGCAGRGPLVLASNHASYVDVPALLAAAAAGLRCSWPRRRSSAGRWSARSCARPGTCPWTASTRSRAWPTRRRSPRALEAGRVGALLPRGHVHRPRPACGRSAWARSRPRPSTGVPVVPARPARARGACCATALAAAARAASASGSATPMRAEGEGWRAVVALRDRVAEADRARTAASRASTWWRRGRARP